MEITNSLLNDLGADPKVYSDAEKKKMGEYADKIIEGKLNELLEACSLPEDKLAELKSGYEHAKSTLISNMTMVVSESKALADILSSKSSIFSSSLSDSEKDSILVRAASSVNNISSTRENMLTILSHIFNGLNEFFDLQAVYNSTLAELGMINLSAMAAENDEDIIMPLILDAYEKLTDLTAFTNDLKDKAVIYQKAVEIRISDSLASLTAHLDFAGDGKQLNVVGAMDEIVKIKKIAEDVIHSHA